MLTDIKLRKVQLTKIIQSDGFLGYMMNNLANISCFAVPIAKDFLPKIATKATSSVLDELSARIWLLFLGFTSFQMEIRMRSLKS